LLHSGDIGLQRLRPLQPGHDADPVDGLVWRRSLGQRVDQWNDIYVAGLDAGNGEAPIVMIEVEA